MTGLRTIWGVSFGKIENEFGEDILRELIKSVRPFIEKELLEIKTDTNSNKILVTTKKGKFLADGIASDLFMI